MRNLINAKGCPCPQCADQELVQSAVNVNTHCPVGCPSHPRALCNLKHFAEGNPDGKQIERTQREYNQEREEKQKISSRTRSQDIIGKSHRFH